MARPMARLWPLALLVLAYPLVTGTAWLFAEPLYAEGAWQIEGRVVDEELVDTPGRYRPLRVAHVEVQEVLRDGEGERPRGTIALAVPEHRPGHTRVVEGRTSVMAVTSYAMHDPWTHRTTFQGFGFEDAKTFCCWSSRVDQWDGMASMLLLGALAAAAAWWSDRGTREWRMLVPVAAGACVALLAGAWSNETLPLIQGDGEENYGISTLGLVAAGAAWVGLGATTWLSARRPQAWLFSVGFAAVYPIAATDGSSGDFGIGVAALGLPVLAVLSAQREGRGRWVSASMGAALVLPLAFVAVTAYRSPYQPDVVTGTVLIVASAGIYAPAVADGLWAWRPQRRGADAAGPAGNGSSHVPSALAPPGHR